MVETDASVGGELILLVTMIGLLYQVKRDGWEGFPQGASLCLRFGLRFLHSVDRGWVQLPSHIAV